MVASAEGQTGQVRQVVISGNDAVATSKDGMRHHVRVPDETAPLAADLSKDNVDVVFQTSGRWTQWVVIVLPNIALGLFIAGCGAILYFILRRPHPAAAEA